MKISQIPEGAEMHVAGIVFDPKFSQILIVNNKAYKENRPALVFREAERQLPL